MCLWLHFCQCVSVHRFSWHKVQICLLIIFTLENMQKIKIGKQNGLCFQLLDMDLKNTMIFRISSFSIRRLPWFKMTLCWFRRRAHKHGKHGCLFNYSALGMTTSITLFCHPQKMKYLLSEFTIRQKNMKFLVLRVTGRRWKVDALSSSHSRYIVSLSDCRPVEIV